MEDYPVDSSASSDAQNHKIYALEQNLLAVQTQNQSIQEQLAQLFHVVTNQTKIPETPATETSTQPKTQTPDGFTPRPKPVLPNPPKFSGDRKSYEVWRREITNKIRIDAASIGPPTNQFAYINSRLEGAAAQMCLTFVDMTAWTEDATPDNFISYLDRSYSDPNRELRASQRLRTMKQGDVSFSSFLPRFERALAEAGGSSWADKAKITFLEGTLNKELLNALVGRDAPQEYGSYVSKILNIDGQLQAVRRTAFRSTRPSQRQDNMDWEPTETTRIAANRQNLPRLTAEERARCQAQGLCFRCRQKGHRAQECPGTEPRPRTVTKEKTCITKTRVEEVESEKEEASSVSSAELN
jgi:hypothetical protein